MKKYEINSEGRVVALRDFGDVKAGEIGGFVESERNLIHDGNCWVFNDARVSGDALVYGDARVSGNAQVYGTARVSGDARISGNAQVYGTALSVVSGNARVSGDARVSGNAQVSGNARVYGNARVSGDAWVYGDACIYGNAKVFGNARVYGINRSDGYTFVYVSCADGPHRVIAGCRYFTMQEAREHWGPEHQMHAETYVILDALEELSKLRAGLCV